MKRGDSPPEPFRQMENIERHSWTGLTFGSVEYCSSLVQTTFRDRSTYKVDVNQFTDNFVGRMNRFCPLNPSTMTGETRHSSKTFCLLPPGEGMVEAEQDTL